MKYIGPDYYNITNLLTEEELVIQKTAHNFVKNEFMPFIQKHFREGTFPVPIIPRLGEIGVFGSAFPRKFGGAGVSYVAYGLLMQELERGDSGLRSFASVQGGLVMYPILKYGSELQKKKWMLKLAKGEIIGCFGLTEPEFGSNPGGMITHAKRKGKEWILNGSKMWITNGSIADIALVWAKDEDNIIRCFIVTKDTEGFSAPEMRNKLSLRASVTSELVLNNVIVSDENRLPKAEGIKAPLSCLSQARYSIAWGVIGAAIDCYEIALEYSKNRKQFSKTISSYQLTQKKLVDMLEELTKALLLMRNEELQFLAYGI